MAWALRQLSAVAILVLGRVASVGSSSGLHPTRGQCHFHTAQIWFGPQLALPGGGPTPRRAALKSHTKEDGAEMGAAAHCERGAAGVVQEDGGVLPGLRGRAVSLRTASHTPCPLGTPCPQTQCPTPILVLPNATPLPHAHGCDNSRVWERASARGQRDRDGFPHCSRSLLVSKRGCQGGPTPQDWLLTHQCSGLAALSVVQAPAESPPWELPELQTGDPGCTMCAVSFLPAGSAVPRTRPLNAFQQPQLPSQTAWPPILSQCCLSLGKLLNLSVP